jgi:hypothetical protein
MVRGGGVKFQPPGRRPERTDAGFRLRPDGGPAPPRATITPMKSKKLSAPAVSTRSPASASVRSPEITPTRTPPATGARAATDTRIAARPSADDAATRERIATRAYAIWLEAGQPEGRDIEHWLEAQRQLGLDTSGDSLEHSSTHTAATAREVGSDEFRDRVEDTMDEIASPNQQRSPTGLDV